MESRSQGEPGRGADAVVSGPDGDKLGTAELSGERVTVGRLAGVNDIAFQPDSELLVTRANHCAFERDGMRWAIVDGGSINGTFLRRDGGMHRVEGREVLRDGDVVCVLGSLGDGDERRYFELAFHTAVDSQATRAVLAPEPASTSGCLSYDANAARLVLIRDGERN